MGGPLNRILTVLFCRKLKLREDFIMKAMKGLTLCALISLSTVLFGACSNDTGASDLSQLEQIKEAGKLVVGTSADYPPYEFHVTIDGEDQIVGFEMDMAREIANDLGVELEIKDMAFDGLLSALQAGNIDIVISGMSPTPERMEAVNFSEIYYNGVHNVLVNTEDLDTYKTIDSLKDASFAVQKASLQEAIATDVIQATDIKGLTKISDLFLELQNDRVDAIIVSQDAVPGFLAEYPNIVVNEAIDFGADFSEGSAAAVKKSEDTSLIDAVNESIEQLQADNKIEEFIQNATELAQ